MKKVSMQTKSNYAAMTSSEQRKALSIIFPIKLIFIFPNLQRTQFDCTVNISSCLEWAIIMILT